MAYISIVPNNRDLLVINDMDTFAQYFCYAKKQKKGAVAVSMAAHATEDIEEIDRTILENPGDVEEDDI